MYFSHIESIADYGRISRLLSTMTPLTEQADWNNHRSPEYAHVNEQKSTRSPSPCLQLYGSSARQRVYELTRSLAGGGTQAQRLHRCCARVAGLFLISILLRSETRMLLQYAHMQVILW